MVREIGTGINPWSIHVRAEMDGSSDGYPNPAMLWDRSHGSRDLNTLTELPAGDGLAPTLGINSAGRFGERIDTACLPHGTVPQNRRS